ncbi:MAG: glycoside hydrolase family 3 N-terminal domain-containing protein [Verrucomicrobiota bacterium]|jgi:beta-N-acetylhexosaminidase
MSGEAQLRAKIGQMVLLGFRGYEIGDEHPVARDLADRNIGGVILYDQEMADPSLQGRNIQSPGQVRALVRSLQQRARAPLLVAIDQEGGRVNRLKEEYGFPATLSHEELGAANDPARTFAEAAKTASTLAGLGINLNLAPVVDLDAAPDNPIIKRKKRSFGADPDTVSRHAIEFARAHHRHGILTCAKHFPGHGSARGDTHLGLVDVTEYWTEAELAPFERLIQENLCDTVMTAHLFNARLDANRPATLSEKVVTGLLRRRLGFEGVIVSDDLEMKAIASHYGLEQAILLGLQAGLDVLCFGNNLSFDANIGEKVCRIIYRLVDSGKIGEARIDDSFRRIQKLKDKLAHPLHRPP